MRKRSVLVIVSILFFGFLALSCLCIAVLASLNPSELENRIISEGNPAETVAIIRIEGEISDLPTIDFFGNEFPDMATQVISKLDQAISDDSIKAVILAVNSPGGSVYASKRIYNKVEELKESDKKVVVLMEDTAASGGYYISAPADKIIASEMTVTGSIGVILSAADLTGLYEKLGIEVINIANTEGNLKVIEDFSDKNSEGYLVLQGILDDFYSDFVNVVAKGRGMSEQEVIKLADGRIYSGRQAYDNGLVDELGELETAQAAVAEIANLENPRFIEINDQENPVSMFGFNLLTWLKPEAAILNQTKSGITPQYLLKF